MNESKLSIVAAEITTALGKLDSATEVYAIMGMVSFIMNKRIEKNVAMALRSEETSVKGTVQ